MLHQSTNARPTNPNTNNAATTIRALALIVVTTLSPVALRAAETASYDFRSIGARSAEP